MQENMMPEVKETLTFNTETEEKKIEKQREIDPKNICDLVSSLDDILATPLEDFDFDKNGADAIKITEILFDNMLHYNGVGLASNQIGLPHRVFIMHGSPVIVCFNPRIVDMSEEMITMDEGCLTYPDLFVKIKRPRRIKVRFQTPDGKMQTEKFHDMTARIFLHEMDHMEGKRCFGTASDYAMQKGKKERKLIRRHRKRFAKMPKSQQQMIIETAKERNA